MKIIKEKKHKTQKMGCQWCHPGGSVMIFAFRFIKTNNIPSYPRGTCDCNTYLT